MLNPYLAFGVWRFGAYGAYGKGCTQPALDTGKVRTKNCNASAKRIANWALLSSE